MTTLTDIGAVTLADGRRLPAVEAARAMVAKHGKETHSYEITGLRRAFDAYWAEVSLLLGERAPAGSVLVVEPEQLVALGRAAMAGEHADQCRLHDFTALKAAGLDLPGGTVELRQGDGFCAVTPEGRVIEST